MRISFPFLRAKHLRMSLLIMIPRNRFTLLYVGGAYERVQGLGQCPPPVLLPLLAMGTVGCT